jgi:four helix bundle protein
VDLPVWSEAVAFASEIYRFCEEGQLKWDYRMRDQLRAASASIASNIAEGFENQSRKSLLQFLFYAKGSSAEVFTQLTILYRAGMISEESFQQFSERASALNQKIGGFIKYLKANKPIS